MSTDVFSLSALKSLPELQAIEVSHAAAGVPSISTGLQPAGAEAQAALQVQLFERSRIADSQRPRRWTPEARAASDFLAHAMEYLADSRELSTGRFTRLKAQNAESEAILILMEAKRQVALSLPFIERRKGLFAHWKGVERRRDRQN